MRTFVMSVALLLASSGFATAQYYDYGTGSNPKSHSVEGYTRSNGTFVAPHYETNPNNTTLDNYGTRGNYNPYTGQTGTRNPY